MSALSTAGLLRAHLRSGLGAAALTATLVAVTVFVAAAVPSALAALTTAQLQHAASELSTARRDLTASGPLGPRFAELVAATNTIADITDQVEVFPRQYGEPLESVLASTRPSADLHAGPSAIRLPSAAGRPSYLRRTPANLRSQGSIGALPGD